MLETRSLYRLLGCPPGSDCSVSLDMQSYELTLGRNASVYSLIQNLIAFVARVTPQTADRRHQLTKTVTSLLLLKTFPRGAAYHEATLGCPCSIHRSPELLAMSTKLISSLLLPLCTAKLSFYSTVEVT